jgi:serine/threonine-protein kinase
MQLLTTTQTYSDPVERPVQRPLERGAVVAGRYVIERALGSGGHGIVFRAFDQLLEERVALKVLASDGAPGHEPFQRMAREARLARAVRHPHVCPVYDLARADGYVFLTMELAQGSLADELGGAVEGAHAPAAAPCWAKRLDDARAICQGVAAIHAAGVAHRDLKPENVLRMSDGRLAVGDFGIAIRGPASLGGGTPSYLPPEVILGLPTDRRSDLWQLGFLLYEVLLGERPSWTLRSNEPIRPAPRTCVVPDAVASLLDAADACLTFCPDARPTSAAIAALRPGQRLPRRRARAGQPGAAAPEGGSQRASIQASESGHARSSRSTAASASTASGGATRA